MEWDEAQARLKKSIATGDDLRTLSIAELEARIAAFEAEIQRTRAEIEAKKKHGKAASDLFKSG